MYCLYIYEDVDNCGWLLCEFYLQSGLELAGRGSSGIHTWLILSHKFSVSRIAFAAEYNVSCILPVANYCAAYVTLVCAIVTLDTMVACRATFL